jgi:hypothetical protein
VDEQRSRDVTAIGLPARIQPGGSGQLISVGAGLPVAGDAYFKVIGVSKRRETPITWKSG